MGESRDAFFRPEFNRTIAVSARDDRITSNSGVVLLREIDHRLGVTEGIAKAMRDPRDQDQVRYELVELLRERIYALAMGEKTADGVDLLAHDPAFRAAVWDRAGGRVLQERLASQPTQSRLLDILADDVRNLEALRAGLPLAIERHSRAAGRDHRAQRGTLDIDSFPIDTHGSQPGAAYNGYYGRDVYHPLLASFSVRGDFDERRLGDGFLNARLRNGDSPSAKGALAFILDSIERASRLAVAVDLRMDAAFMNEAVLDPLNERSVRLVGRLATNPRLEALAAPHLVRPVGRPPSEGYEFVLELGEHKAESWRHNVRVVLVVVDKPDPQTGQLELFPRHFFLGTTWKESERSAAELLEHYRARGTFEDRIGEFNRTVAANLPCQRFEENEATLLLGLLAYNLVSIVRGELESDSPLAFGWDLGRVQKTVLRAGGRFVSSGRRLILDVARAVLPLWSKVLKRMAAWVRPSGPAQPRGPIPRPWMPPPRHAHLSLVLRE